MSSHESASISGWCDKALIDLAEYLNGMAFKPSDWTEEGAKIIRIEQLNNPTGKYDHFQGAFPEEHQIDDGDLIFSWSATLKVALWRHGPGVLNQHLFKVVPRHGTDKHFLYHLLDYYMEEIAAGSHGSTMRHIKRGELTTFRVSIPCNEAEQRKIAHILTTLDAVIERTEALIAKYEAIKQGLLHDLLTRGVDAQGRLRPSPADAPQLYRQSPLGWAPKEWEVVRLGDCLTGIDAGKSPNCPDIPASAGQWGVLKVSAVHPDGFRSVENKVVIDSHYIRPSDEVRDGDLLITRSNTYELVGLVCLVRSPQPHLMICDKTLRLNLEQNAISSEFAHLVLQQPVVRRQIEALATGTSAGMKNISQASIRSLFIPLPPLDEQRLLSGCYQAQEHAISSERSTVGKLKNIKAGLMQDLLTGRVRVKVDQEHRGQ